MRNTVWKTVFQYSYFTETLAQDYPGVIFLTVHS